MSQRKPWLSHMGGAIPVPDYAAVVVRYRDGSVIGPELACTWDWTGHGESDDIVAYYRTDADPSKRGEPQSPDRGPWQVNDWREGRLVLQSDDFGADVALEVSGDFASHEQKRTYAEALAAWMNHHLGVSARPPRKGGSNAH